MNSPGRVDESKALGASGTIDSRAFRRFSPFCEHFLDWSAKNLVHVYVATPTRLPISERTEVLRRPSSSSTALADARTLPHSNAMAGPEP